LNESRQLRLSCSGDIPISLNLGSFGFQLYTFQETP